MSLFRASKCHHTAIADQTLSAVRLYNRITIRTHCDSDRVVGPACIGHILIHPPISNRIVSLSTSLVRQA